MTADRVVGGVDALTLREAAELIADTASTEWQEADGRRMGATDNRGNRLYFVSADLIESLRAAISNARGAK